MEGHEGGDTCILIADSPGVQQKVTQHCKATILQFKKKERKSFLAAHLLRFIQCFPVVLRIKAGILKMVYKALPCVNVEPASLQPYSAFLQALAPPTWPSIPSSSAALLCTTKVPLPQLVFSQFKTMHPSDCMQTSLPPPSAP